MVDVADFLGERPVTIDEDRGLGATWESLRLEARSSSKIAPFRVVTCHSRGEPVDLAA